MRKRTFSAVTRKIFVLAAAVCAAVICVAACARKKEDPARIAPVEGCILPAITSLAWYENGGGIEESARFMSITEDNIFRIWDLYSGQLLSAFNGSEQEADPAYSVMKADSPIPSPDGTMELLASADGAVVLLDAVSKKEIARYYGLVSREGIPGEWISVLPEGFYNASFAGASFLELSSSVRRYRLDQLSGMLFRPDLFAASVEAAVSGETSVSKKADAIGSLLADDTVPPSVTVSCDADKIAFNVKVSEQGGGAGWLALYLRAGTQDLPVGLFRIKDAAEKTYTENGNTVYEITVNPEEYLANYGEESVRAGMAVSAFNKTNTVESERYWLDTGAVTEIAFGSAAGGREEKLPLLRVLSGRQDSGEAMAESYEAMFLLQKESILYSDVQVKSFYGNDFSGDTVAGVMGNWRANAAANDVTVLYLQGNVAVDSLGDLFFAQAGEGSVGAGKAPAGKTITAETILTEILGTPPSSLILFDINSALPAREIQSALLRFRRRMGQRAMLAVYGGSEKSAAELIIEGLVTNYPGTHGMDISGGGRFVTAGELLAGAAERLAANGNHYAVFNPATDFSLGDRLANAGEIKFQSMASGMLFIARVDAEPVPLAFGETKTRALVPGSYSIDMIYRNGYRETRTVNLRRKESVWVVFSYIPPSASLYVGSFPGGLQGRGINISELNPVNYERINREAMEGMGMQPYYVSFLAGEKLYRDGNYAAAVGEYSRSLLLKSDYIDAYISRGNAYRRLENYDRAIDDYSRAIGLDRTYAEVFNYRGFVYAQKGDIERAIQDYTQAIRGKANYADAYFNRARAYSRQGNWELAAADYSQVLRIEPSNAAAYNGRGNAWLNLGDQAKASADYTAAERAGRAR